jgi:hypothetical protein
LIALSEDSCAHWCLWAQLSSLSAINDQRQDIHHVQTEFQAWRDKKYVPDSQSFWGRSAAGDIILSEWLIKEALEAQPILKPTIEEVIAAYQQAFNLRSSDIERDTVTSHLADLVVLSEGDLANGRLVSASTTLSAWKA